VSGNVGASRVCTFDGTGDIRKAVGSVRYAKNGRVTNCQKDGGYDKAGEVSLKIESDGVGSEVRSKYSGMSSFGTLKSRSWSCS